MVNKEGERIFMDIYSKLTDSERYVSFKSNHPNYYLKKTSHFLLFSLACRICMITQKDSLKEIKLKELESECYWSSTTHKEL